jgi:hypothetical protein
LEVGGETRFRIVETEKMAYLTHISVAIRAGNDAAIKKYLADKVQFLKVRKPCPCASDITFHQMQPSQESNIDLQQKLLLER